MGQIDGYLDCIIRFSPFASPWFGLYKVANMEVREEVKKKEIGDTLGRKKKKKKRERNNEATWS